MTTPTTYDLVLEAIIGNPTLSTRELVELLLAQHKRRVKMNLVSTLRSYTRDLIAAIENNPRVYGRTSLPGRFNTVFAANANASVDDIMQALALPKRQRPLILALHWRARRVLELWTKQPEARLLIRARERVMELLALVKALCERQAISDDDLRFEAARLIQRIER
jgi:hypothetical protein